MDQFHFNKNRYKKGINCPYCGQPAEWCENKKIYGQNYGKSWMCYYCQPCDAYVGCHNNTRVPLGTMANKELREWRKKAHAAVDPLWKGKLMTRSALYDRLADLMGKRELHIGESDVATCQRVIEIAPALFPRLF